MKVLATFDGTPFAEATLPLLARMAAAPSAEFVLLRIGEDVDGRTTRGGRRRIIGGQIFDRTVAVIPTREPEFAETKEQAVERRLAEIEDYLLDLAKRLPEGAHVAVEAHLSGNAARSIIDWAGEERPEVIVMATHSRSGLSQVLFGSTTDQVIRSGIAPVLVVHPTGGN